jgi:hypothetical protein
MQEGESRYNPTPSEIAEVCREIQAGWTPEERIKRRRVTPSRAADSADVEAIARQALEYSLARRRAKRAG